jgi:hypothetical protein
MLQTLYCPLNVVALVHPRPHGYAAVTLSPTNSLYRPPNPSQRFLVISSSIGQIRTSDNLFSNLEAPIVLVFPLLLLLCLICPFLARLDQTALVRTTCIRWIRGLYRVIFPATNRANLVCTTF